MPLKVSSEGWVKVVPPPPSPERRRRIDPEEQKESLCAPLRYFACQQNDPGRERLRVYAGRAEFGADVSFVRPVSRLERTSTLEEWRNDARPSRSSSRQSGFVGGDGGMNGPMLHPERNGSWLGKSSKNKSDDILSWTGSVSPYEEPDKKSRRSERGSRFRNEEPDQRSQRNSLRPQANDGQESVVSRGSGRDSRREKEKVDQPTNTPIIKTVSPPSTCGSESVVAAEDVPDNVSVAYSETPSERNCRHKHRHSKSTKTPTVINEEEEEESVISSVSESSSQPRSSASSQPQSPSNPTPQVQPQSQPQPPPQIQPQQIPIYVPIYMPHPTPTATAPAPVSIPTFDPEPNRTTMAARSPTKSESSRSRRSESVYTSSTRSSSPVSTGEGYYPATLAMMNKSRRSARERESSSRPTRDRVATAPESTRHPSPPASVVSSSSHSSYVSKSSRTSTSSAPSLNGYQFQAAIFQPKDNYRGYRAPSLSRGNRWETATSALSFE